MYRSAGWLGFLFSAFLLSSVVGDLEDVVFVVVSQSHPLHSAIAEHKKYFWRESLVQLTKNAPTILLTHEAWAPSGAWTIAPLFPVLSKGFATAKWFFFASEETEVDFRKLEKVLERYDFKQPLFLGHALWDTQPTILHHYAPASRGEALLYPHFPSGWLLSSPLLHKAASVIHKFNPNFNIDSQYELASFLKYMSSLDAMSFFPEAPPMSKDGTLLTHVPELCMADEEEGTSHSCATSCPQRTSGRAPVDLSAVWFAVKTCEKYHHTRLPVLTQTWGHDAAGSIGYYSDVEDPAYSTSSIGVPNTEQGHCGKTMAIIYKFSRDFPHRQWLVIVDDDTLLSVRRLVEVLGSYNASVPTLMGEVYGYKAHLGGDGSAYVTGGGGMVLSRAAVSSLVEVGYQCPHDSYPDDMFLGTVAKQLGMYIVHSTAFHQAQPRDYPTSTLMTKAAISFHRHQPQDPFAIYKEHLMEPRRVSSPPDGTKPMTSPPPDISKFHQRSYEL
ncbi:hypothetical protein EMCRGX_G024022 [Ephydatia muelleri]